MKGEITETIEIPEEVEINIDNGIVNIRGPKGEARKELLSKRVNVNIKDKAVVLSAQNATKREKRLVGTFKAHLKNMIKGAVEGHMYRLKICSSHFPMTAEFKDNTLSIKNFLGESVPRTVKLAEDVDIKIEGDIITIESPDKERAGTAASRIEELCKIRNKDRRIFQDGIFMISKAGKEIE